MKIRKLFEAEEDDFEFDLDDDGFQKTPSDQDDSKSKNVSSNELLKKIAQDMKKKGNNNNFYGTIYSNIRNLISLWQEGR